MELFNEVYKFNPKTQKDNEVLKDAIEKLIIMLSPFTPHIAEELWKITNHNNLIIETEWPEIDKSLIVVDEMTLNTLVIGEALKLRLTRDNRAIEIQRLVP